MNYNLLKKSSVNFNELPKEIQEQVRMWLEDYDRCNVTYSNTEYKVRTHTVMQDTRFKDYKFIGIYAESDIK